MDLFFNDMVEEIALEVYFELHRAVKLGYFEYCYPEDEAFERHAIVENKSTDVFGNSAQDVKKFEECTCPKCARVLGTAKFAPHLEKCLGMGRNSSRIANKKLHPLIDSDDDEAHEGEEWTFPEKQSLSKNNNKVKKKEKSADRPSSDSPRLPTKTTSKTADRSKSPTTSDPVVVKPINVTYTVAYFKSLSSEEKRATLQEMCGVISERTKRLCTRSVNCPQHSEEQKQHVRATLIDLSSDVESAPSKKPKLDSSTRKQDASDMPTMLEDEKPSSQRKSWSPHNSHEKTKKSSTKKHSSKDPSKKPKGKKANKRPATTSKTYTDMPLL